MNNSDEEQENVQHNVIVPKWVIIIVPIVALLLGAGMTLGIVRQTVLQNTEKINVNTKKFEDLQDVLYNIVMPMKSDIEWIKKNMENEHKEQSKHGSAE